MEIPVELELEYRRQKRLLDELVDSVTLSRTLTADTREIHD